MLCAERVAAPTASELQSNGFMDTPGRAPGDTPGRTPGVTSGASPSALSGAGAAASRGVSPAPGSAAATPAHMADDGLPSPPPAGQLEVPSQAALPPCSLCNVLQVCRLPQHHLLPGNMATALARSCGALVHLQSAGHSGMSYCAAVSPCQSQRLL